MKLESPSQLGPWVRQEELLNRQTTYLKTNNSSFRQHLILPRVNQLKPYIIKIRQTKYKPYKPIKVKPLQLSIGSSTPVDCNQSDPNNANARKSRTLSFDPPKISFYNKNFPKPTGNTKELILQATLNTQRALEQSEDKKSKRQINKVDLIIQHKDYEDPVQLKQCNTSSKVKQKEFAKKRSLMELLKFMKCSYNQSSSQQREQAEKANKLAMLSRYEGYRNMFSQSIQAQSRYIPYFEARKSSSLHPKRK